MPPLESAQFARGKLEPSTEQSNLGEKEKDNLWKDLCCGPKLRDKNKKELYFSGSDKNRQD